MTGASPNLALSLGISQKHPRRWQRGVQRIVASRLGSSTLGRLIPRLDPIIRSVTADRITIPELLGGLPVVQLTTVGARTGRERTASLIALSVGNDLVVVDTGFGRESRPGWSHNLEANPQAVVMRRRNSRRVTATLLDAADALEILPSAVGLFPGNASYADQLKARSVRLFRLAVAA